MNEWVNDVTLKLIVIIIYQVLRLNLFTKFSIESAITGALVIWYPPDINITIGT